MLSINNVPIPARYYFHQGCKASDEGRWADAVKMHAFAVTMEPSNHTFRTNYGMCLISQGDWRGYDYYKSRFSLEDKILTEFMRGRYTAPMWSGEDLSGKTIICFNEQGLGDAIQMARYARLLPAKKVCVEVQNSLVDLFKFIPEFEVVGREADYTVKPRYLPPHDYIVSLNDLPGYFKCIPDFHFRFEHPSEPRTKTRIGLCWAGSATHQNDGWRSIPIDTLRPLFDLNVEWCSLQVGGNPKYMTDKPLLTPIKSGSFLQTALAIWQLDAVVTVDTAVAHLAGLLRKPTYVLVSKIADYRWGAAETTPWYPTMTLIRQEKLDNWQPVVARLCSLLSSTHTSLDQKCQKRQRV